MNAGDIDDFSVQPIRKTLIVIVCDNQVPVTDGASEYDGELSGQDPSTSQRMVISECGTTVER